MNLYTLRDRLIRERDRALASDRSKLPEILDQIKEVTHTCLRMEIIATKMEG